MHYEPEVSIGRIDNVSVPNPIANRERTFARQLEEVANTAAYASQVSALERHLTASRAKNRASWERTKGCFIAAKQVAMAAAFAASFLQYYFLSVTAQIMQMRPVAMVNPSPTQIFLLKTPQESSSSPVDEQQT